MALQKSIIDPVTGAVTSYHRIERVMVNFSGDGSIEIVLSHYANETVRDRLKAGEMAGPMGESNEYIPLGLNQSFDRAVIYPRLKLEAERYQGATDI